MGGMMNAAVVEIVENGEASLPAAHFDPVKMARLALAVAERSGFENVAVPFCMTVEPEALGSEINPGSVSCEPKVARERYASVEEVPDIDIRAALSAGRVPVVLKALSLLRAELRAEKRELPLVVSLSGPISTAAAIVDPPTFFKELRKKREAAHRAIGRVTDFLSAYAVKAIEAGAEVVAIGDPSATGEILGPALFEEFAVCFNRRLVEAARKAGAGTIVHICGDTNRCRRHWPAIGAAAVSVDAMINIVKLKEEFPELRTMGNVSTFLLEMGTPGQVAARVRQLIAGGVDIIAPACGLSTSTRLEMIRALTDAVKG
jgi:[methyl-Co(III) methanol-specific corrinoid protein]:coenzyme M methyltransferase